MTKNVFTILLLVAFVFTTNILGQIQSNGTGGGSWDSASTWQGGLVPGTSDNVIILGTDSVSVTAAGACANLTMNAGAILSIATGLTLPGTSWNLDVTSTVWYLGVPSSFVFAEYGNLVYAGANYSLSNNLTVHGDLNITTATLRGIGSTSGEFTHNIDGDVIVGPGTGARISAVNQSSATTASCTWNIGGSLYLTGNNSGNRLILFESAGPHSGTAKFVIGGDLVIGTTNGSASQVQFRSSSGTIAYGTGVIDLKGNLVKNGKIGVQANSSAGSFDLNLIGTSNQSWSGVGFLDILSLTLNVNVNNPSSVTLNSPQTLGNNVVFNLTNGNINTDSNNLLTVGTGSLIGGSSSSFVNGPLAKSIADVGPVTKSFPVGKDTAYRPVDLTITHDSATATTYTVEMFNESAPVNTLPPTLNKVSKVRYYTISKAAGATVIVAKVKLSYDADDFVTDFEKLRIAKDDGAGNWIDIGGSGTANITGTIESTTDITTFSNFVLANDVTGDNTIPVELSSFIASVSGNYVLLNWSTGSENNNYGFEIQRSLGNGENKIWENVGFVKGIGSSTAPQNYSFKDKLTEVNGFYFYRLKQIDFDGSFKYSDIVEVITSPLNFELLQNYPNPFNPATTINYSIAKREHVSLKVFDIIGNEVATLVNEIQEPGIYDTDFDSNSGKMQNLTSGIYFYQLRTKSFVQTRKMILIK